MFEFETEEQLHDYLIRNFEKYFGFGFLYHELRIDSGYVDLVGEDEDTVYLIEVKRNFVTNAAIKQIKKYLDSYQSNKNVVGIIIAPKINPKLDWTKVEENMKVMTIDDVKCLTENPNKDVKMVRVNVNKASESIKRWVANQDDPNRSFKFALDMFIQIFGVDDVKSIGFSEKLELYTKIAKGKK